MSARRRGKRAVRRDPPGKGRPHADPKVAPKRNGKAPNDLDSIASPQRSPPQQELEHFFDLSVDMMYIAGEDGHFQRVNAAFERTLGYPAEELLARPYLDLVHPEDRKETLRELKKFHTGNVVLNLENRYRCRDGSYRWFAWTAKPIPQEGLAYGIARDITDRRHFEDQLLMLNETLEHRVEERTSFVKLLQDVAVIANEAGSVDQALQEALDRICRHMDWPIGHAFLAETDKEAALRDTGIWSLKSPQRFQRFVEVTERMQFEPGTRLVGSVIAAGRPEWVPDISERRDFVRGKEARDLDVKAALAFPVLVDDRVVAVLEFFSQQAVEPNKQLLEVTAHVGTQLGRVVERQQLQQELADAFRQTQRHLGQELHDGLCQQLAGIGLLTARMLRALEAKSAPEAELAARLLEAVQDAKRQGSALVKGLLPVDVGAQEFTGAIIGLVANVEAIHGIRCTFECDSPVWVETDNTANHLFRIAQEAVSNALKHSHAEKIVLSLKDDGRRLVLRVGDDGVGVAPEVLGRATGNGMRIMRHRAQAIGASLEVRSAAEAGMVVMCKLEHGKDKRYQRG